MSFEDRLTVPVIARIPRVAAWVPQRSLPALLRAIRATVVLVGVFALTDLVIGNIQMATFAAFGSFATLVLSSFSGTRGEKLRAHLLLALAGSVVLTIGTAVSSSTVLAATVTVPVTFAIFFAGITGPNAASGTTGALLAYVLPAASPGTVAMIPDRLAGWWLASIAGTAAVLLLSPRAGADALRGAVAGTAGELAKEIDAAIDAPREPVESELLESRRKLQATFNATPYRPLGLAARDEALANVVELLGWCTSLVLDAIAEQGDLSRIALADERLLRVAAATLRDTESLFGGRGPAPDLEPLEERRGASLLAVEELDPTSPSFQRDARISFHAQAIAVAVLAIGADALVAERPRELEERSRPRPALLRRTVERSSRRLSDLAGAVGRNASLRSVWFVNSLRASLALGAAVAIADLSSVQHGFWVVLGTLSVLRTNAASTRATALQAVSGTVAGFVIGGALLVAIGSSQSALWPVLPVAVFIAAYSPGTAPFAVGQAAFTVTVAILFNLIAPVGWTVGLVRIEDVVIGCGVSVVFGALFWPRGVAAVVGNDLADAYRSGAAFLAQSVGWTAGLSGRAPDGEPAAVNAGLLLDDALRAFLAERGSKRIEKQELWRLVGGTLRLRLTAHAVAGLPRDPIAVADAREALERRTTILADWYNRLAALVDRPAKGAPPALAPPSFGPEDVVPAAAGSHYGVWLCEHLDHLAEHLDELVQPAVHVAELRRAPWWR